MFNRWEVCEAYYLYDILWGPTPYNERLHRMGYHPGVLCSLETASPEVKAIYGRLVREHNQLYVAYQRMYRRHPAIGAWPGTYNMPDGAWSYLKRRGLLAAIATYA